MLVVLLLAKNRISFLTSYENIGKMCLDCSITPCYVDCKCGCDWKKFNVLDNSDGNRKRMHFLCVIHKLTSRLLPSAWFYTMRQVKPEILVFHCQWKKALWEIVENDKFNLDSSNKGSLRSKLGRWRTGNDNSKSIPPCALPCTIIAAEEILLAW